MAKFFDQLTDKLISFIEKQKVFFVATAAADGRINLSPKGYDALKVVGPSRIIWLNLSGSGNETAAHLKVNNRMTLMFCSFDQSPLIMRIYGSSETIHPRDTKWDSLLANFPSYAGARQIFDLTIDSVQTSCGFGVPNFEFIGERSKLVDHYEAKGPEATEKGWSEKNAVSIDGLETGIVET